VSVALVIQTRVAEDGVSAYVAWQSRVGEILQGRPGFLSQEVTAPSPPGQPDWIVVQRFAAAHDARVWMQSEELRTLLKEVSGHFVGPDERFLLSEAQTRSLPVSALVTCQVDPAAEDAFRAWEGRIFRAEVKAPGFVGHKLNPPVPGLQENWVIVVSFDTEENLQGWLDSPERAALLEEGQQYREQLQIRRTNQGFALWARGPDPPPPGPLWVFKSNLIVLLVLYPTVYLWGYLVGSPLIDGLGAPPWLSLFLGNLASTQLLGWFFVPWALKRFEPWMRPTHSASREVAGWAILLALYALSMAGMAWILTLPPLRPH